MPTFSNPLLRRHPTVLILIPAFIDALGAGLTMPVFPLLVGLLTPSVQQQSLWLGILTAGYGAVQFLFAPLLGSLSDRFGRRPLLILSMLGSTTGALLTATAQSAGGLLIARLLCGATASSFAIAGAYIADSSTPEQRSRSMGLIGAMLGLGLIAGTLLGGLLGGRNLRAPFFAIPALAVLNILYCLFVLPESLPRERRSRHPLRRGNPVPALLALGQRNGTGRLVGIYALAALAQTMNYTIFVLFLNLRFGWGSRQIGTLLALAGLAMIAVQGALLGHLTRHLGEARLLLLGLGSSVLTSLGCGLVTSGKWIYLLTIAGFLGFTVTPCLQGLLSKAGDASRQGQVMGSLSAINNAMLVIGPLLASPLLALVSDLPRTHWALGAPIFAVAAIQVLALLLARQFHRLTSCSG